jgi:Zn-dependent peptidase ImmA (M78 family)
MAVSQRDEKRIKKLINSFLVNHALTEWTLAELILINDLSPKDDAAATIAIDDRQREFVIRVYTNYIGTYEDLGYYVIHELTHLFLHEVNAYIRFLARHEASQMFITEAEDMYEKITYKLSKVFCDTYLAKL